jgi:TIR domain
LADIFFSYARPNLKRVESLVAALEDSGWSVWWDSDVHGGDSWSEAIEAELTQAKCVIVAWSQQSAKSEWVKEEARIANRARKLVPVLLESMEPPFGFGGVQTVDLSGWEGNPEAPEFLRLCSAIRRKLAGPALPVPPVSPPVREAEATPPSSDEERKQPVIVPVDSRDPAESGEKTIDRGETRRPEVTPQGGNERRRRIGPKEMALVFTVAIPIAAGTIGWFRTKDQTPVEQPGKVTTTPIVPAETLAVPNGYTVYLHTKLMPSDVDALTQRLKQTGYKIGSRDSDVDNDSGRVSPRSGVDYAAADPDSKHRNSAANAAQITNELLGTDLKPRPQSGMSPGNLGIWLPYKADYTVSIRFAGEFDRPRDIVPFAQKLRAAGWSVTEPKPAGGSDRTLQAAGLREVRYTAADDRPFAELLAADVQKTGIVTESVTAKPISGVAAGTLEIWISSGARKAAP